MTIRTTTTALLTLLMAPIGFSSIAMSGELNAALQLCEANPLCTHASVDAKGGIAFKVRRANGTVARLYCAANGECNRVYPRSQIGSVEEASSVLALK